VDGCTRNCQGVTRWSYWCKVETKAIKVILVAGFTEWNRRNDGGSLGATAWELNGGSQGQGMGQRNTR